MTNVWHVVSTAWYSCFTQSGNSTTCSSCLSVVLYWRRLGGWIHGDDVTSSRRDVNDSLVTSNVSVVDSVVSHFTYEWSSADTRQTRFQSATYSWRSSRQTTMSRGSLILSTLMTTSSGLYVSVLYSRIVEDSSQTTYIMLLRHVTPCTSTTISTTVECIST